MQENCPTTLADIVRLIAEVLDQHYGVDPARIELTTGTLSKSLVTCGGYIGGSNEVINWLRASVPGFVYSVGIAPPVVAGAWQALSILREEAGRVVDPQLVPIFEHVVAREMEKSEINFEQESNDPPRREENIS